MISLLYIYIHTTHRCYVTYSFHKSFSPFYQLLLFLAFSFPSFSLPSHHSIFCKMSALVRHRVSLFGKLSVSPHLSEGFHSFYVACMYFSVTQVRASAVVLVVQLLDMSIQYVVIQNCIFMCRNGCFSNC